MNNGKALKIGAWALAGAVLCGALVYYNFVDKATEGKSLYEPCPDFTVRTYKTENGAFAVSDNTFTLSDYKNEKVVVLNFWTTWCAPCKHEIPFFNEFYEDYSEQVEVVIINAETSYTPEQFVGQVLNNTATKDYENYYSKWTDFTCTFARSDVGNEPYKLFNVSGAYPVTVVIDKAGTIAYITERETTYQSLEQVVLPLLNG